MKTRKLVSILIFVLAVQFIAVSCATMKKAISHEDTIKKFSGTWVNLDNPVTYTGYADPTKIKEEQAEWYHFQKFVLTTDSLFECYHSADDLIPFCPGKYTVKESWVDRKSNTYCLCITISFTASRMS